jgi:hypothetical protein
VKRRPLRPLSARRYKRDGSLSSVARVSPKRLAERQDEAAFRRAVHDRAQGFCEAEPVLHPGIRRRGVDVHHVYKRSAAPELRFSVAHALLLCRSCHHFTESHPHDAITLGLLGRSWSAPRG